MTWGWRALSPTGPFTAVNGHPLSYSDATTTGWKKVVVLMTDGQEEWPATANMTGLGQIADGKIGTTSSTSTAVTNLGTRLASVCSNMAAQGYLIYTIGLGNDGSSNTELQNCAANGGFLRGRDPKQPAEGVQRHRTGVDRPAPHPIAPLTSAYALLARRYGRRSAARVAAGRRRERRGGGRRRLLHSVGKIALDGGGGGLGVGPGERAAADKIARARHHQAEIGRIGAAVIARTTRW